MPVEVLWDTGSARTLVWRELVPEGKVKMVGVRCAHGEVVHYPTAELEVVVGDKKIITKAGVSDDSQCSCCWGVMYPNCSAY